MSTKVKLALIESYIGENFLTYTTFCKLCGISMTTFNKIQKGQDYRITALIKISKTINVGLSDLIE